MTRKMVAISPETHARLVKILPKIKASGVRTIGGLIDAIVEAEYDRRTT